MQLVRLIIVEENRLFGLIKPPTDFEQQVFRILAEIDKKKVKCVYSRTKIILKMILTIQKEPY